MRVMLEIVVLPPDASKLTDKNEVDEKEVNTREIIFVSRAVAILEVLLLELGKRAACAVSFMSQDSSIASDEAEES
ncbi:hypothetical protein TNCV_564201 [Trichonephila clavipes]|nr:hypothetical protein TNCV_564201 [Trichonephila clavipes]